MAGYIRALTADENGTQFLVYGPPDNMRSLRLPKAPQAFGVLPSDSNDVAVLHCKDATFVSYDLRGADPAHLATFTIPDMYDNYDIGEVQTTTLCLWTLSHPK